MQCEDQFVRLADNSDEQMIGGDDGEIATEPKPIIYRKANVSSSLSFFFLNPFDFLLEYVFLLLQPEELLLSSLCLVEIVNNFF